MTAEELIAKGPTNVDSKVEAMLASQVDLHTIPAQTSESVKVTSVEPPKIDTDKIKSDGTLEDPLEKFKSIVTEKKTDDKKEDSTVSKDTTKPEKQEEKEKTPEPTKEEDVPKTARFPKPKLEDQLKEEDLSDLDPSALEYFKKMDKSAREYVKARLKENKDLKDRLSKSPNSLPQNWFDHEEAYILHPEFRKNIALATRVNQEVSYWKDQLRKVRLGETWQDLEQGKDGLVQVDMKPDVNAEDELNSRIREGERLSREYNAGALSVKTLFEQQRSQSVQALKTIEEKFFPQYVQDKEHSNHKYVKAIQETLGKFNQSNNILAGFITNLYRFALERCDEIAEMEKKLSDKKSLEEERIKGGPTSEEIQGGRGKALSGDEKPFDIAEFNKYKGG